VYGKAVKLLQSPMTALAQQYLGAWDRLGPIGAGQEFFRIHYFETEELPGFDSDSEDDGEPRTEHLYSASLRTLPAAPSAVPQGRTSDKTQTPEGFELVIKRGIWMDGDDEDDDDDTGAEFLYRKKYPLR
jgi:hypothetical protein